MDKIKCIICETVKSDKEFSTKTKCKECIKEYKKQWYEKNKKDVLKKAKEKYQGDKEVVKKRVNEYRMIRYTP